MPTRPSRPIRAVPTFWISMPPLALRARDFGVLRAVVDAVAMMGYAPKEIEKC